MPLSEQRRKQLDGVVLQMAQKNAPKKDVDLIVNDFVSKYGNEQPQKQTGFISNLKTDFTKRIDSLGQTLISKANPLSGAVQTVGTAAGMISDIVGEGIKSVTPNIVKTTAKKVGTAILQTDFGKEGLKYAAKGIDAYNNWKKNNPETAKDIEAVVNIATLFPIGKGAKTAAKGIEEAAEIAGKGVINTGKSVGTGTKYLTSQATGLSHKTIDTIIKNPKALTKAEKASVDALSLGTKIKTALTSRLNDLKSTGKKYEAIRRSSEKALIPENTISNVLSKYGIGVANNKGKLKLSLSPESVPLKSGDKKALQDFVDMFGGQTELSGNAFINARKSLSNLASYGTDKSDVSQVIAKELRQAYDGLGKQQLTGLAKLDAKYAPEKQALSKLKKEFLTPEGELKDTALSKIANATNEGRQKILNRLEKLSPGIGEEINIYKALRDIDAVKSQKVGSYAANAFKSGVGGFAVSGGNPFGAALGMILSAPQVAVPIIKSYGRIKKSSSVFVNNLINKLKTGKSLSNNEKSFIKESLKRK